MPRLSTSSSERKVRPPHGWRWGALIVLALCLVEAVLRVPAVREALPPRTHYYDQSIAARLDALERTRRSQGRIDVLFVGSSIVRTNVHPLLFDQIMAMRGRNTVSFNAGLSGLWPEAVALYLEHLWLPVARPRMVVQGIRYPELAATTPALRPEQVVTGTIEAGWLDESISARIKSEAVSRLHLLQYHGVLTRALERWATGAPGPWIELEGGVPIDERGHTPRLRPARDVSDAGFEESQPATTSRCVPDGCDRGFAALARAIEITRAAGATYVLLNVPEHASRWHGADGQARHQEYITALHRFAAEHGVTFLDPSGGDAGIFASELEYADMYHMSPAGAERLTRWLADATSP